MRVIISGGGTGGHIYPAVAIADEIKRRSMEHELLFVGASDRMEMTKVPKAGYDIEGLWIAGIQRKWSLKNLVVPFKVLHSLQKSRRIIRRFKPDVLVGVGGYASGPLLYAGAGMGVPALIQEQNSFPGITNKLLAKKVNTICTAYDGLERFFPAEKIVKTGNPVRNDILHIKNKSDEGSAYFEWDSNKNAVLIFGGSLGANSLNEVLRNASSEIAARPDCLFIWQTGATHFPNLQHSETAQLANVRIMPFIDRMDLAYGIADVIVSRAGALTISELCVVGKPAILVPSPYVAEDHQNKNAEALVEKNAALRVKDDEVNAKLFSTLFDLLGDMDKRNSLCTQIKKLASPHATKLIVDQIEKLIKGEEQA